MQKLKARWGLQHNYQVLLVLVVFALTGTTVMLIKPYIMDFTGLKSLQPQWLFTVMYLVCILPVYQLFLLIYGFCFGLAGFFWEREKRLYQKIRALFVKQQ